LLPVVIIAWGGSCLHDVTIQGYKLHAVTQFRCLHCSGAQPAPFWGGHPLVNRSFLCLASYRFSLADKCSRKPLSCRLSRMSGSSCVLCDATALVLCCAVAVTGTSKKPSAAGASGSAQEARAWKRVPFRCWRTLHPTVDCRLQACWAASSGWGSATAPSCVGYTCTPQHHSSPFRALPCSSC